MSEHMSDLEPLAHELGRLFLRLHRLMDRRMAQQGASLARTKLLLFLEREGGNARAADIADFFGHAPRTVTEAIDALERDGLVRRDPDPVDRRVKRVSITDAGRAAAAATEPMRLRLVEQVFGVLDDAEQKQLGLTLSKLSQAVDRLEQ